MSLAATG